MARDISTPLAALSVALDVIAGYQYDIRNSRDSIGVDLQRRGFCGGAFYRNATLQLQQALLRFQQEADAGAEGNPPPGAEVAPAPEPPVPPPPANPYPLRDGSERFLARTQLANALAEVRRLEYLVERLDEPFLRRYVDAALVLLEHLERALAQSPNPYPLDEGIIAKGEQP